MAESRIKVPSTACTDFDFLAFSFNGKHSYDDFGLYRVSNGSRYEIDLTRETKEITAEVPGGDGMYYFGTTHTKKQFSVNFVFDHLTEQQLADMKKWLNTKDLSELWFEEEPYKIYMAKPTGRVVLKTVSFEEKYLENKTEKRRRIYKGEGNVVFIAYWPYAHTPDYVGATGTADGRLWNSYSNFLGNKDYWKQASGLLTTEIAGRGENPGDIPAPFILIKNGWVENNTKFKVGDLEITTKVATYNLEWDSKTGIVSGTENESITSARKIISITGKPFGGIPVGGVTLSDEDLNGATLKYHYWYY